jgi:hypothetical protein
LRQLRHGSRMPDDVSCYPRYRSRSRLLATPSGSTAASPSVSATSKTCSPNAASRWPTRHPALVRDLRRGLRTAAPALLVTIRGRCQRGLRLGWRSHRQLAPAQPESPRRRARKLLRSGPVPRRLVTYRHGRHGRHTGSSCRPSGWRRPPGRLSILGPDTPMARSPVASALSQRSRRSIRLSEREHSNRPTARSTTSRPSHARA